MSGPPVNLVCGNLTPRQRLAELFDIIILISDANQLRIPTSPQFTAFEWLVNRDPAQVCPEDVLDVRQRYIAAVLYFSTNGDNWLVCNEPNAPNLSPCSTQRYLSAADVCNWFGSDCNNAGELNRLIVGKKIIGARTVKVMR